MGIIVNKPTQCSITFTNKAGARSEPVEVGSHEASEVAASLVSAFDWGNGNMLGRRRSNVSIPGTKAKVIVYTLTGKKIDAIKALREMTNCSLGEAKDMVEALIDYLDQFSSNLGVKNRHPREGRRVSGDVQFFGNALVSG